MSGASCGALLSVWVVHPALTHCRPHRRIKAAPSPHLPVTCPSCASDLRETVDDSIPMLLVPCGHSLCRACCDAVMTAQPIDLFATEPARPPQPLCPVCRSGISSTSVNAGLAALGEAAVADGDESVAVAMAAEGLQWCHACQSEGETVPSSFTCAPCGMGFCEPDAAKHRRRRPDHALLPVSEDVAVSLGSATCPRCPKHPGSEMNHFCVTDACVMCSECALYDHAGHEFGRGDTVIASLRGAVRDMRQVCNTGAATMQAGLAGVAETVKEVKAAHQVTIPAFLASVEQIKALLDARAAELVERVHRVYGDKMKALEGQEEELCVSAAQLAACVRVCDLALSSSVPSQLSRALLTSQRMSALAKRSTVPIVSPALRIVPRLTHVQAACDDIGYVTTGTASAPLCTVTGPGRVSYHTGDGNVLAVMLLDAGREPVLDYAAARLNVRVEEEGVSVGAMTSVTPADNVPGSFTVTYAVNPPRSLPIRVYVEVAGVAITGSALIVPPQPDPVMPIFCFDPPHIQPPVRNPFADPLNPFPFGFGPQPVPFNPDHSPFGPRPQPVTLAPLPSNPLPPNSGYV